MASAAMRTRGLRCLQVRERQPMVADAAARPDSPLLPSQPGSTQPAAAVTHVCRASRATSQAGRQAVFRVSVGGTAARMTLQKRRAACCAGNVEWGDKALQVAEAVLDRPENSNLSLYLFR